MEPLDLQPSIVANSDAFDAASDALALRNATKGLGTDEDAIVDVMARRTNAQRVEIAAKFQLAFGVSLCDVLESELHGELSRVCQWLARPLVTVLAEELQRAMDGPGTDEDLLVEVLCSRSNLELRQISAEYERLYERPLRERIEAETSGNFRRLLLLLLEGRRDEPHVKPRRQNSDDDPADAGRLPPAAATEERAVAQAEQLYAAGEGRLGTGEKEINLLLATQSWQQLRLTARAYETLYSRPLIDALRSETSGDYKHALVAMVTMATDPGAYFAARLRACLQGVGTSDRSLCRVIISRADVDLATVAQRYAELYERQLHEDVASDTSGRYGKVLLKLLGAESG